MLILTVRRNVSFYNPKFIWNVQDNGDDLVGHVLDANPARVFSRLKQTYLSPWDNHKLSTLSPFRQVGISGSLEIYISGLPQILVEQPCIEYRVTIWLFCKDTNMLTPHGHLRRLWPLPYEIFNQALDVWLYVMSLTALFYQTFWKISVDCNKKHWSSHFNSDGSSFDRSCDNSKSVIAKEISVISSELVGGKNKQCAEMSTKCLNRFPNSMQDGIHIHTHTPLLQTYQLCL